MLNSGAGEAEADGEGGEPALQHRWDDPSAAYKTGRIAQPPTVGYDGRDPREVSP